MGPRTARGQESDEKDFSKVTFRDLKCGDGLPFVHGYEPSVSSSTARQVDDQLFLVVTQGFQDGFESVKGKLAIGK